MIRSLMHLRVQDLCVERITDMNTTEADFAIERLDKVYASKVAAIQKLYDDGIYKGNWDVCTEFDDGTPNLRFIEDNEYDQHRTDDMPDWDDIIAEVMSCYVFLA